MADNVLNKLSGTDAETVFLQKLKAEFDKKSDTSHTHDDRYYKKSETDAKVQEVQDALDLHISHSTTWCGCRWRLDSVATEGEPVGSLAKIEKMASIFGLGGYLVASDHTRQKLSASDHNYLADGQQAVLDGSAGHYQWGSNVPIYYAHWKDTVYEYEAIDIVPIPGHKNIRFPVFSRSCAGFAALDRTNLVLMSCINKTAQFRGGNNSNWDGTWRSLLGKPVTNINVATVVGYARANGTLWFVNERAVFFLTAVIKRIFFHNRNIQAAVNATLTADNLPQGGTGQGVTQHPNWTEELAYNPYIDLDAGLELGDYTGSFSVTGLNKDDEEITLSDIPSFLGLKNDYKYLWATTEDELFINNTDKTQSMYIDNNIDGHVFDRSSIANHTLIGTTPSASAWQWIKEMQLDNACMVPTVIGASETTGWADGYYNPASGNTVLRGAVRLGDANNAGRAGSGCLNGDNAPSYADAHGGFALCEFSEAFTTEPTWY
ncbi:MAG: hypothetical protein II886_13160 [Prevotella sp.]|nr:hypothetical protein [Prevotella sp.]